MKCTECGADGHPWWDHEEIKTFGEQPIEPYFDEHISTEGEWITTRAQRRKIMDRSNFEYKKTGKVRYGTKLYFLT